MKSKCKSYVKGDGSEIDRQSRECKREINKGILPAPIATLSFDNACPSPCTYWAYRKYIFLFQYPLSPLKFCSACGLHPWILIWSTEAQRNINQFLLHHTYSRNLCKPSLHRS